MNSLNHRSWRCCLGVAFNFRQIMQNRSNYKIERIHQNTTTWNTQTERTNLIHRCCMCIISCVGYFNQNHDIQYWWRSYIYIYNACHNGRVCFQKSANVRDSIERCIWYSYKRVICHASAQCHYVLLQ